MKKNILLKDFIIPIVLALSTSIIAFNNIGQTFQLFEISLTKSTLYWIGGTCLVIGIIWEAYLNKLIKL